MFSHLSGLKVSSHQYKEQIREHIRSHIQCSGEMGIGDMIGDEVRQKLGIHIILSLEGHSKVQDTVI